MAEYSNVDTRMFQNYFDTVAKEGNPRMEEPVNAQDLYAELTKVLQAVVTDQNADVQALMDTANTNLQQILDDTVEQVRDFAEAVAGGATGLNRGGLFRASAP